MKNKAKLIEIIKGDCKIKSYYFNNGETCAVGAIALASGISSETLEEAGADVIDLVTDNPSAPAIAKINEAIANHFGLSPWQLGNIQRSNDSYENPEERQASILSYLSTLPDYDMPGTNQESPQP